MQFILLTAHTDAVVRAEKGRLIGYMLCVSSLSVCVCVLSSRTCIWFFFSSCLECYWPLSRTRQSYNSLLTFVFCPVSGSEKIHVPCLKLLRFLLQRWAQGFSFSLPFLLLWPPMTLLLSLRKVILNPLEGLALQYKSFLSILGLQNLHGYFPCVWLAWTLSQDRWFWLIILCVLTTVFISISFFFWQNLAIGLAFLKFTILLLQPSKC